MIEVGSASSLTTFPRVIEEEIPLISPRATKKRVSTSRILTNILSPISLIGASVLLTYEIHKQNPDSKIITACYLDIGVCSRVLLQANLPTHLMDKVHNGLARWSFECYELLWNWYLNESNQETKSIILNLITALGGYHITGDIFTAINLKKGDRSERTLAELSLDAPIVNKILAPDYNHRKKQILLKTMMGTTGIGLTILGYAQDSPLQALYISLGYFLAFQGIGFFSMEKILKTLERTEKTSEILIDINSVEGLNVSLKKRFLRTILKVTPRMTIEGFALLSLVSRMHLSSLPLLCVPAGILAGATEYHSQREFQILTRDIHEARKGKNLVVGENGQIVRSKALKVDLVATVAFFTLFVSWFTYGFIVSPDKERVEIATLVGATLLTMGIALFEDNFFEPEKCGRGVNTIRYLLHHNPFLLAITYFGLTQITAIDDVDLRLDPTTKYVCGLVALALFGFNLSANRIRYTSLTRSNPAFTPPMYRIEWIKTVFLRFMGRLGA